MLTKAILEQVSSSTTLDELTSCVVGASEHIGFGLASGVWIEGRFGAPSMFLRSFGNPPEAFLAQSKSLPEGLQDPVLLRGLSQPGCQLWDQSTYVSAGAADLWDAQAVFGYRAGVSVALHAPGHAQAFVFGVDGLALPRRTADLLRLKAAVNLIGLHAHQAMANIVKQPTL